MNRRDELDIDDTLYIVTDKLGLADTCITAAERLLGQPGGGIESTDIDDEYDDDNCDHDDDDDPSRIVNHLAHLIDTSKQAVRAAQSAHAQAEAKINRYCAESVQAVETAALRKRGKA